MPLVYLCIVLFIISICACFYKKKNIQKNAEKSVIMSKQSTNSIRGIAIIAVFLSHITVYAGLDGIIQYLSLLGGLGVSIFLFLSGFGNSFSIQRTDCYLLWMLRKTLEIIVPFILSFVLLAFYCFIFKLDAITGYCSITSMVTLTVPGTTTWYLKIQLLCYFMMFLGLILINTRYYIITFAVSIAYVIISSFFLSDFWWHTVLCFPFGILWKKYREKHRKFLEIKHFSLLVMLSGLTMIVMLKYHGFGDAFVHCFFYLLFVFLFIEIAYFRKPYNRICEWIGKKSLPIYLIHIGLFPALITKESNLMIVIFMVVILTILGAIIVDWLSKYIIRNIHILPNNRRLKC